jgi:hypothetical protein
MFDSEFLKVRWPAFESASVSELGARLSVEGGVPFVNIVVGDTSRHVFYNPTTGGVWGIVILRGHSWLYRLSDDDYNDWLSFIKRAHCM